MASSLTPTNKIPLILLYISGFNSFSSIFFFFFFFFHHLFAARSLHSLCHEWKRPTCPPPPPPHPYSLPKFCSFMGFRWLDSNRIRLHFAGLPTPPLFPSPTFCPFFKFLALIEFIFYKSIKIKVSLKFAMLGLDENDLKTKFRPKKHMGLLFICLTRIQG